VAGEDRVRAVDQHRVREPEGADAVRDLPDLLLRMRARVPGPGPERLDRDLFNYLLGHAFVLANGVAKSEVVCHSRKIIKT
jgi:hypothetical protein